MKSTSLESFMEGLSAIEKSKEDYVVPSSKMCMSDPETIGIDVLDLPRSQWEVLSA